MKLMRPLWMLFATLLIVCAGACARGKNYELNGQILAVDPARREITIKHQDIKGFMPGMTMTFKVRDAKMLEGRTAGDLIRGTLVVNDTEAYLKSIESTGHAPLTEAPPAGPRIDPMDPGDLVPDASFVDDSGRPHRLSEWRGRALAVTFIYTRCPLPDFCPLMDRQFADVQRQVLADPQLKGHVHLLSISIDPTFDTPAVLSSHAKALGADHSTWSFLTGTSDDITAFAGRFGVAVMRDDGKPNEVVHNLRTGVIDANGKLVTMLNGIQWQPSELLTELRNAVAVR